MEGNNNVLLQYLATTKKKNNNKDRKLHNPVHYKAHEMLQGRTTPPYNVFAIWYCARRRKKP